MGMQWVNRDRLVLEEAVDETDERLSDAVLETEGAIPADENESV